jgi:DNA polymerase-3 subunit alpha
MADRPFVHLHCHTHYSLLDGASRIPELIAHVKGLGMSAVAITDHGNLYGAIEFYRECKAAGLNPIIGYEAYVAPGRRTDREPRNRAAGDNDDAIYHHLTLLAKNHTGFRNLCKMASLAFLEGYHYKPRIDKELLRSYHEGIICLSGCAAAEFSDHILRERTKEAEALAREFHELFGNDFYIEIQNNGLPIQQLCAEGAIDIANRLGLPLVATSDAHYLTQADNVAHDVLLCINTGRTRANPKRFKFEGDQFHVRGPEEMYALFPDQEAAVRRSQEIADAIDIELDFKKRHFPVFVPPAGKTPEQHLRELCEAGLLERYRGNPSPAAHERLAHELNVICRMGFAGYFLIVWDFVRFARDHGIPAGARGSGCGALVSYVLKISHVDPLEYDLLFERFLDPNRAEAPDIDIDFCQDRREEVIAYVRQKYGEESVAQIATFGTLGAKAALRDVGRVLDVPQGRVNQLANWVPRGLNVSIDDALKQSSEFREAYETDPQVRELVDIAQRLEGTNRQAGIHAAGVVIANGPITDYVPVHRAVRKNEEGGRGGDPAVATQWVMGDLEKVGLLKMDFLGLRTLTLLHNCVAMIERARGIRIDLQNLPPDDPETYALLQRGDAKGVFQLESEGIRALLIQMKPENIRDISAIMAMYRPGPLQGGMVDSYVNCKHGRERPNYPHPVMEEVLAETYGVMVYQEQIQRILNRLGGIELGSAYACIKAISKKKQDVIDERYAEFVKGAQERGLTKAVIDDIWNKIIVFAGYGFNKAHTAAYALVGYQTAYLKAHFTPEFMAALLSSEIDDGNKRDIMVEHIADARRLGVAVLPPDVNASGPEFTVAGGSVLVGLTAIKGLGRGAADEIVRARREGGPYKDLFDFCERVDSRLVPRSAVEKLIKAGGCDRLGRRTQLLHVLPRAVQAASDLQRDRKAGQMSLFAVPGDDGPAPAALDVTLPDVPDWPETEKLKYEKEALDFYISSHPLAQYEGVLRRFSMRSVADLATLPPGQEIVVGGMLSQVRFQTTKTGRRYVRCNIEDMTGSIQCAMWPDDLAQQKEEPQDEQVCFVRGRIDPRSQSGKPMLMLTRFLSVEQAQRELTQFMHIVLRLDQHQADHIDAIARTLRRTPGRCPVWLDVRDPGGRWARLRLSEEFHIDPLKVATAELEELLGQGAVKFSGIGHGNGRNGH